MSDSAFGTGKYPTYSTTELTKWLADHTAGKTLLAANQYHDVCAELARRAKVRAGYSSAMSPGERLRFVKNGGVFKNEQA